MKLLASLIISDKFQKWKLLKNVSIRRLPRINHAAPNGTTTMGCTLNMLNIATMTPVNKDIAAQLFSPPVVRMKNANFLTNACIVPSFFTWVKAICLIIKSESTALIIPQENAKAPRKLKTMGITFQLEYIHLKTLILMKSCFVANLPERCERHLQALHSRAHHSNLVGISYTSRRNRKACKRESSSLPLCKRIKH